MKSSFRKICLIIGMLCLALILLATSCLLYGYFRQYRDGLIVAQVADNAYVYQLRAYGCRTKHPVSNQFRCEIRFKDCDVVKFTARMNKDGEPLYRFSDYSVLVTNGCAIFRAGELQYLFEQRGPVVMWTLTNRSGPIREPH
jgi:hypothetical protein